MAHSSLALIRLHGIRARSSCRDTWNPIMPTISRSKDLSSVDTIHRISAHFRGVKLRKFLLVRTNLCTCIYTYIQSIQDKTVKENVEWINNVSVEMFLLRECVLFTIRQFDHSCSKYIVNRLSTGRLLVNFLSPFSSCAIEQPSRGVHGARTRGKIVYLEWKERGSLEIFHDRLERDGEMVTMSRVKSGEILSWQRLT